MFLEAAFCRIDSSELAGRSKFLPVEKRLLTIDRTLFVESARKSHEEYSDDNLKLLYRLYETEWSRDSETGKSNLFNSLTAFAKQVLTVVDGEPRVNFNNLFRWRELTYIVGEELLTCAYLARRECTNIKPREVFNWSGVLLTDNAEMNYLLEKEGLTELHQHLKASTDVFAISWVCLMNHVKHRKGNFVKLFRNEKEADEAYYLYIEAVAIRLYLYRRICQGDENADMCQIEHICQNAKYGELGEMMAEICTAHHALKSRRSLDYACIKWNGEESIYEGERRLLYEVLRYIYLANDAVVTELLHKYVLAKAKIRAQMVQVNKNVGFANFARFEEVKEVFIDGYKHYSDLLKSLPVQEAMHQHCVTYLETRIAPKVQYKKLLAAHVEVEKLTQTGLKDDEIAQRHIIYHFIKKEEKKSKKDITPRNHKVRIEVRNESVALRKLQSKPHRFVGLDAANSEMFCRPEVFAQAYRYLDDGRVRRTYHAGEDFFDLTDGLRTIDEAIKFLQLRNGDRIGHGIALGIDAHDYYASKHWHIPVPKQVLLDNIVWLYYELKSHNITMPSCVERLVEEKYRELADCYERDDRVPSMENYYLAMGLRGNDPYTDSVAKGAYLIRDWRSCAIDNRTVKLLTNENIFTIYRQYHFSERVRREGDKVVDFVVPRELAGVIGQLQEAMMCDIAKRQIAIECCPTSNVKIARLKEYEKHPILRLHPMENEQDIRPAVSINTDDLGIFVTSADNEYALIALALMKQKDKDGRLKYSSQQVRNWLETVILQSKSYRFGSANNNI